MNMIENKRKCQYGFIMLAFILGIFLFPVSWLQSSKQHKSDSLLIRNIEWNDINFIHTTDTHGWYSGHINQKQYNADWGDFISFTSHLRDIAHSKKQDFLLVDTGDRHDGNGLSDVTIPNGAKSLPIFMRQDYDLLTIGNHELYIWENSQQEYDLVRDHFKSNYISTNVEYKLQNGTYIPMGQRYKYFTTPIQSIRILSFAFLFDFARYNSGTKVEPIMKVLDEDWFKDILIDHPADEVDLLVIIGHIPVSHNDEELFQLHLFLRKYYPKTKIQYFGGHSHIRDFSIYDEYLTGLQSGRFCETAGWVSINLESANNNLNGVDKVKNTFSRSYIDFNLNSFMYHTNISSTEEFHTGVGLNVSRQISDTRKELNLEAIIGYVRNSNYFMDYVSITNPKNIFKLLTDKVLPTLEIENPDIATSDQRLIIINTGSIRYDLYKGPYTLDSQYIISPFENDWVKLTLPKNVAIKIAPKLNELQYIIRSASDNTLDNRRLLPEHQYSRLLKNDYASFNKRTEDWGQHHFENRASERFQEIGKLKSASRKNRLSKGYVTYDDFGHDGDDTLHRPVVNHPIPNVVQSEELNDSDGGSSVDVVFYSFITPNILWALKEIGFEEDVSNQIEFYSKNYLGLLLNEYIRNNDI